MFRVVDCQLTSKDGVMTAILTLSGVGYDYLFMGTKEEADQADRSTWIPFTPNAAGKYTYPVPVSALDTGIAVAGHSKSHNLWYDRILTFNSGTLEKIADLNVQEDPSNPDQENKDNSSDPNKKKDDKKKNNKKN